MKINCIGKNLKEAVLIAERNTTKNQTLPVLGSILIETSSGNKLKIKATNLETAIEIIIPSKIEKEGSVVVPGKSLSSFLSNILEENIIIQNQNDNIYIKTPKTETVIKGYKKEEFPIFPKVGQMESIVLNSSDLKNAFLSVVVACSVSDIKPELSSVFFKIFKNTIKFASTDSFRLAEKTIISKNNYLDRVFSILIPQKSVVEIIKLLQDDENTNLNFNKNQLVLESGNIKFFSRLIDGVFPEYDQIIPKSFKTESLIKNEDFLNSLKLASIFAGRLNDVSLDFDIKEKIIKFNTSNSDIGEHNSQVQTELSGEDLKAKYNWKYLLDGVFQIKSDYISLGLNGEQSPMVIKGKGDNSFLYLVMPMRGI